ncbi:hypothetical protein [Texcoconibacillus texcoconensis]|uniref:Uncharacterized protein with FMN-binding domain n=1 Tax=Texcoconibacillus texcoconensis TaxID=1095777 RepID=A0A840QSQ9_9BACI|nr:hypothetical protein [Texcoconibacillus texcoconensis]MBB5174307.1 uncharacterized protein with FMN-binding domain [Texcoconibacillus texcoconensis]
MDDYDDGTYHGVFADGENMQVNVQFTIEGNAFKELGFRHLAIW